MKTCKTIFSLKELSVCGFHLTATILICFSIAYFVVFLAMYTNEHVRKFLLPEEIYYFPQFLRCSASVSSSSSSSSSSSLFSNSSVSLSLTDWMAPRELWHSMSDDELMWRASMVPHVVEYPYNRVPKVAFLFLSKGGLPLAPLWEKFFKGYQGLYSVYLHTSPEFNQEAPPSSVFYKRRIPSKPAEWGRSTMIDAERRLLANALLDFSNERFVLLSEACIPLFNFTAIYNYLVNSTQSFQGSFDDPRKVGRGRYNKLMHPTVLLSDWRKVSQWFEIHRKVAIKIVSDSTYYPVFRDHCKPPCYSDEHYFATLVTKNCPDMNSNRSLTWVDWSRGGSHPATFVKNEVSETFLNQIRHGFNCTYNGFLTTVCFLFARKFHPNTLQPLLRIAPVLLGFDP